MNNNGGRNSKTINDLDDNMLTQILFRLPSCAPVVACKLVNKRWCSLISDPKFPSHFSDHKKESTTLSKPGSDIDDDEPPWTFIANMVRYKVPQHQYCGVHASTKVAVFGFPKLSLGFLPCDFHIKATFMDLVLCYGSMTSDEGDQIYYITSAVTKQWVALPPCPGIFSQPHADRWAGLVIQQPCDYTRDYKFRVVVIDQCPAPVYKLLVYCSEIGEWKKFNLSVSLKPELAAQKDLYNAAFKFQGVVCNGIIYLHHRLYFAAFNPFDVDEATDTTTIEAKVLPLLPDPVDCFLQESSGHLYIMHNSQKTCSMFYTQHGKAMEFPLVVWKLDPNQVPLIWTTTFEGFCTGNLNIVEDIEKRHNFSLAEFGMHPNNDKLIYMYLWREQRLVLCDTRTRLIKPLKSLPRYRSMTLHRLELQWWPTSVPKAYLSNASP